MDMADSMADSGHIERLRLSRPPWQSISLSSSALLW
jgi:hypothetical protein